MILAGLGALERTAQHAAAVATKTVPNKVFKSRYVMLFLQIRYLWIQSFVYFSVKLSFYPFSVGEMVQ